MKQSAAKTLGVAVLGAAFAASAAGAASASALPQLGATDALGVVTNTAESLTHKQAGQEGQATDAAAPLNSLTGSLGGLPLAGQLPLGG
ncbi:hypothetical protein DEJ50_20275 [Streptomyces venezuelae]|uniref:Secreted protein n=1 Tax=Streptomyces venezuelae TaxID=54571 RepID=A0A5P2D3X7_STRVZ|nr:hypothetical protein [Streptomyces venezuelae]QES49806.1 hypothetical protein DEJ50_20275 [Streptomyces venezuelae]